MTREKQAGIKEGKVNYSDFDANRKRILWERSQMEVGFSLTIN